ncbi:polyphosphate kinase 2 [Frigidibacter sp. ROC022]|uniref:polyphosphate kinase 2 n=1 Tax=Frigidibacter sp. ROC022 TaxID=2971796 RepID=UPI00215A8AA1|nr:polyphosphate kinase 2 [Frigidibacter sp. ROC022]MCR8726400.1 polyphosphate kinase 2 [Frigidibacter sp. ROC022]
MPLPFDGAISKFYAEEAPDAVREAIKNGDDRDILRENYPYDRWMKKKEYQKEYKKLQLELAKFQGDVKATGKRVVVIFEGRDAAGKGGAINAFRSNLNPRQARVVALTTPTETERGQWYFQRYVEHLPTAGEIVMYDRSWYNRGVVEHVFGFCTPEQREAFFRQLPNFEALLVDEGIRVFKLWLNVGRAEQLRRFLARENDPRKQWKLSTIDVQGLSLWDEYSSAIGETLQRSHTDAAPWTVVRADDKYRSRIGCIQTVLSQIDYAGKDPHVASIPDPKIVGGPELWDA